MMENNERKRDLFSVPLTTSLTGKTSDSMQQAWTPSDEVDRVLLSGDISSSSGVVFEASNTGGGSAQYFFGNWKQQQRQQQQQPGADGEPLWQAGHISPSSSSGTYMASPVALPSAGTANDLGAVMMDENRLVGAASNFLLLMDQSAGGAGDGQRQQRAAAFANKSSAFPFYGSTPEQQHSVNNFMPLGMSSSSQFAEQQQPFTLANASRTSWSANYQPQQHNTSFFGDYTTAASSSLSMEGGQTVAAQRQQMSDRNLLWNGSNLSSSASGSPQHQHRMSHQDYSLYMLQQQQQQQQQPHANVPGRYNSSDNAFSNSMGPAGDAVNHDTFVSNMKICQQQQQQQQDFMNSNIYNNAAQIHQQTPQYQHAVMMPVHQQQQQLCNNSRHNCWSPTPGGASSSAASVPASPYMAPPQQAVGYYYSGTHMPVGTNRRGPSSSISSSSSGGIQRQQQPAAVASFAIGHWNSSEEAKALQQQQHGAHAHHHQYPTQPNFQQQHNAVLQHRSQQQQQLQAMHMTHSAGDLNVTQLINNNNNNNKENEPTFDFNGKFGMFVADPSMYSGGASKNSAQQHQFQQQQQNAELKQQHSLDSNNGSSKPLTSTGINNFFNQLSNDDHANGSQQQQKQKRIIPGLALAGPSLPPLSASAGNGGGASGASKKAARASRQRGNNNCNTVDAAGAKQHQGSHQAPPPAPVVDMDAVAAAVALQLSDTPFSYAAVARKKTLVTNSGGSSTAGSGFGGAVGGGGGGGGTPQQHQQTSSGADGNAGRSRTASVDAVLHAVGGGRSHSAAPSSPATAVRGSGGEVVGADGAGWHEVVGKQQQLLSSQYKAATGKKLILSVMGKTKKTTDKPSSSSVAGSKKRSSASKSSTTSGGAGNARAGNTAAGDGVGSANKFANISLSDEAEDDDDDDDEEEIGSDSGESPDELTLNNMKQIDINSLRKARATLQITNNDLAGAGSSNGQMLLLDKLNNQLKAADTNAYYLAVALSAGKKKNTNIQQQTESKLTAAGFSPNGTVDDERTAALDAESGYNFSLSSILWTVVYFAFLFIKVPLVKTCVFVIFMVRSVLDSLWHVWFELYQATLYASKHSSKSLKNLQGTLRRNWLKFKRAFAQGGREQQHASSHHHHHHYHHYSANGVGSGGGGGGNADNKFVNALTTGDQVMRRLYYADSVLGWNPYDILGVSDTDRREIVEEQMTKTVDLVLQDVALRYGVAEAIKLLTFAMKLIVDETKKKEIDKALKRSSCITPSIVGDAECFLQRMREKYDTKTEYQLPCYRCGKKHMRYKLENRDLLNGRYCKSCGCHHQVKEGDIWCETTLLGLMMRYFACVDGLIYEITAFALCQKSDLPELKPSTHQIYYRIPSPDVYVEDMWLNDLKSCRKPKILGSVAPRSEAMPCGRAARRRKVRAK